MTLGVLVSVGLVSGFLLPRVRDAADSGEPLGALYVGGFWLASVAGLAGVPALAWGGVAVACIAGAGLVGESLARRLGRR